MIAPKAWWPYGWRPQTVNDEIIRNLEICILNVKIAIVFALITLVLTISRLIGILR